MLLNQYLTKYRFEVINNFCGKMPAAVAIQFFLKFFRRKQKR